MVDGTSLMVMRGAFETLNKFTELFSDPATRGITGNAEDATVLFVFQRRRQAQLWSDPATGALIVVRPLNHAFRSRRSIQGAAYVGYRAYRGSGDVTCHHLVVMDRKRGVIERFDNILGFRKEQ